MWKPKLRKLFGILFGLSGIGLFVLTLPRLITTFSSHARIYSAEGVPKKPVAIVFGAGLRADGSATAVLRDRVATAANLYLAGKASVLLMSGDNRFVEYNEPAAMREYALSLGVPDEAIVLDYAGRRTYDTCYRARDIFGLTEAILVTQAFHMPRALYTCNTLGVASVGVFANQSRYRRGLMAYWAFREVLATHSALWDVYVAKPLPVLGNPEPIFSTET